jgi:hypothetical protein
MHKGTTKIYCSRPILDASAKAFISATGLTGTTETTAVNNLVIDLKKYGLWTKMKAIYPFVSDTFNLLSYSQDFSNSTWTKNLCTIVANATTAPNGTNTASKLVVDTNLGAHRVTQAITTNASTYTFSIYAKAAELPAILIYNSTNSNGKLYNLSNGTLGSTLGTVTNSTITNAGNGWYRCTVTMPCTAASQTWMVYGSTDATSGYFFTGNGTDGVYLWGSQLEEASSASTYQPIATTPANRFVSQFKYNLKDPVDMDASFRLAFNGTWTYSKQGATPNGVNAYANTYLIPSTALIQDNSHISYYSRTDISALQVDMGAHVTAPNRFSMEIRYNGNFSSDQYNYNTGRVATTSSTSLGLFASSRISASSHKGYRNGVQIGSTNTGASDSISNINISMYLGAANNSIFYSSKQVAFSTIGNGLTDTEANALYTIVQRFQVALNRHVI